MGETSKLRLLAGVAVGLYLVWVPLISVSTNWVGGHDISRLAQVFIGSLCALALAAEFRRSTNSVHGGIEILCTLVLVVALAGALVAPNTIMGMRELALFAGMASIVMVVAGLRESVFLPSRIASIAAAAYTAVVLIIIGITYLSGQALNRADLFVGYDSYRFFNHTQTAALPLACLAIVASRRQHWSRWVAWFAAIVGFTFLFALAGRATLIGIASGSVCIGILFGRASIVTLRTIALAATFGLLIFYALFWLIPVVTGAQSDLPDSYYRSRLVSDDGRFYLWKIAVEYIKLSPWIGIGPMHYAQEMNSKAAHPHNAYLQIAAEWGLPMLLLLLSSGIYALRKLEISIRNCADRTQRDCGIGLFLTCIAIAVDGLFSGNFVMPVSQVWIACTFGWALAWNTNQLRSNACTNNPDLRNGVLRQLVISVVFFSQLWLVWSLWPEVQRLNLHIINIMERAPNPKINPRFWSHGWF